jgi:drug/metabolite transporter (DMT)-like permease
LGESLNSESLLGALLTLGGVYLVNVKGKAKSSSSFAAKLKENLDLRILNFHEE